MRRKNKKMKHIHYEEKDHESCENYKMSQKQMTTDNVEFISHSLKKHFLFFDLNDSEL